MSISSTIATIVVAIAREVLEQLGKRTVAEEGMRVEDDSKK